MIRPFRIAVSAVVLAAAVLFLMTPRTRADRTSQSAVPEALHENVPAVHALVNGKVVVSPGSTLEKATIIVRDGVIERVGTNIEIPPDARVWDMAGKTIYPGFIDAYSELADVANPDAPGADLLRPVGGAGYYNGRVTSQLRVADAYKPDLELNKQLRGQGVVARLIAPSRQIVKGTSAAVTTGDGDASRSVLRPAVAMHARLTPERGADRGYPNSPMGALALVRQALLDAKWYQSAQKAWQADHTLPRPEQNDALAALEPVVGGKLPLVIDTPDELYSLRADRLGREFELKTILRGHGREFRRLSLIAESKRPIVVPVNFPRPPAVAGFEQAMSVSLDDLMEWDIAPENPARLEKVGIPIALTAYGLKDRSQFLTNVRKAVRRGLSAEAALKALTVTPAGLLGVASTHGTIERGKSAGFVVVDGDLFGNRKPTILETWVEGKRYEVTPTLSPDPRGLWDVALVIGDKTIDCDLKVGGTPGQLTVQIILPTGPTTHPATTQSTTQSTTKPAKPTTIDAANVSYVAGLLNFSVKGSPFAGKDGVAQISGAVLGDIFTGRLMLPSGKLVEFSAERSQPHDAAKHEDGDDAEKKPDEAKGGEAKAADGDSKPTRTGNRPTPKNDPTTRPASFDVNYPFGAYGRSGLPDRPKRVLFKDATVWTSGPAGKLEHASVLLEDGRIAAIVREGAMPEADVIVDCMGKHLSPGIIDCHSHIATDGGVNESGRAITCNVRIADFIDPDDISIYRQLAGGVTSSNILHGSANPIGGQNQVIKLRWGAGPEQLKFEGAPAGVKFALGENPKQSNWGERATSRYPQSRMGVEQIIRDRFTAARDYAAAHERYKASGSKGIPPRVDLEMEALVEIVTGKRLVHCHSYRQDEILALLRTCEAFGVKIATLQHILEGYKVADAIAKHGAGASSFSDWWAYKVEVMDAIPYNGAIMHKAGVVVSFNSDDAEMARRLNLEAAKAVKYGGVSETEALKFVTLNPAKQLGIDKFVGSIEVGKQADLVVWSGSPLSTMSRCEQTWVDGRRYFDRDEDRQIRQRDTDRRAALIQKALSAGAGSTPEPREPRERERWLRYDEFCGASKGMDASKGGNK